MAVKFLEELVEWIRYISRNDAREQMLSNDSILTRQPDFDKLRKALKHFRLDHDLLRKNDQMDNQRLHKTIKDTLSAIEIMADQWRWFAQLGKRGTLNTARLILPKNHRGAVVMDATASSNPVYPLFKDRAFIIPAPRGVRQYDNVTLHVSWGHKVGKRYLQKHAKSESRKLISELASILPNNRKV